MMDRKQYNDELRLALGLVRNQVQRLSFNLEESIYKKGQVWITWKDVSRPIEHRIRLVYPEYEMIGIRSEVVVEFIVAVEAEEGELIVDFVSLGELLGKKYGLRNKLCMLSCRKFQEVFSTISSDVHVAFNWFDKYKDVGSTRQALMEIGTQVTGGVLDRGHPLIKWLERKC
jgi:hypothetical protein